MVFIGWLVSILRVPEHPTMLIMYNKYSVHCTVHCALYTVIKDNKKTRFKIRFSNFHACRRGLRHIKCSPNCTVHCTLYTVNCTPQCCALHSPREEQFSALCCTEVNYITPNCTEQHGSKLHHTELHQRAMHCTLYHNLAIYREVSLVNVTSLAESTE